MKCIVKDCENHSHQGGFTGDLCNPCHAFITEGTGVYSQAYRNAKREWIGLTDNERIDISHEYRNYDDAKGDWFDRTGFARAIESKLREKNT